MVTRDRYDQLALRPARIPGKYSYRSNHRSHLDEVGLAPATIQIFLLYFSFYLLLNKSLIPAEWDARRLVASYGR